MNICIFETHHFEGAYPVIRLFDNSSNNITVITTVETRRRFTDILKENDNKYNWELLQTEKGKLHYFLQLRRLIKKINPDVLYINTINDNHILYAWAIKPALFNRTVLTIHDINCLFKHKPTLNLKSIIQSLGKKRLKKRLQEFNVVSDTMLPYLNEITKENKQLHNIPGAVYENRNNAKVFSNTIRIAVPGSIDKKRRNYSQVIELIHLAEKESLPLHITVLGGYNNYEGKEIIEKINSITKQYISVKTYNTDVVNQDEFDIELDNCHFIWVPSVINTYICNTIPEVYGKTKSSGNIFDIIKHAKPFLYPKKLSVSETLISSGFAYNELQELIGFFQKLYSNTDLYKDYQKAALHNSSNYTIEKVREKNKSLFG